MLSAQARCVGIQVCWARRVRMHCAALHSRAKRRGLQSTAPSHPRSRTRTRAKGAPRPDTSASFSHHCTNIDRRINPSSLIALRILVELAGDHNPGIAFAFFAPLSRQTSVSCIIPVMVAFQNMTHFCWSGLPLDAVLASRARP